jgi:hypothetical protein
MPKMRFGVKQTVTLLHQIEVAMSQGKSTQIACRDLAIELRDALLNSAIFFNLKEAQIVIEQLRKHYKTIRPYSSPGYRPPAPPAFNLFQSALDQVASMQ